MFACVLLIATLCGMGVIVESPENPAERVSGRMTDYADGGDARFLHRGEFSIRLTETVAGSLFSPVEPVMYELRIVQSGVHFVDARLRGIVDGEDINSENIQVLNPNKMSFSRGWQSPEDSTNFITSLTQFDGGLLQFVLRQLDPDCGGRFRSLEIGLLLSVEAGFEHNHGGIIEVEVFRNSEYIGTAHIANITDPIFLEAGRTIEYFRTIFNGALQALDRFAVVEITPKSLLEDYELRFRMEATQNGRHVNIPMGSLVLFFADAIVNYNESGMQVVRMRSGGRYNNGYLVANPSYGIAGELVFYTYIAGPMIPSITWYMVVYGQQISSNSHFIMPAYYDRDVWQQRAVFYGFPYSFAAITTEVPAFLLEEPSPPVEVKRPIFERLELRHNMATVVVGDDIIERPFILHSFVEGIAVSLLNPRVFANFIGGEIYYDAGIVNLNGLDSNGNSVSITLTIGSSRAIVNGQNVDIATFSGASGPAYSVYTILIGNRSYAPLRFFANAFLLPIHFQDGLVFLG